jgi:sugar phosphate permease
MKSGRKMKLRENKSAMNAIYLGGLCCLAYLAVYYARNILSAVTPHMIESGLYDEALIGKLSSLYFILYAVGQLINGIIGDRIKAKYMMSIGLLLAGISNVVFVNVSATPLMATLAYGFTGFSLSMIYAPMTRMVAENTEPIYTTRCSVGYTFSSFFGSPVAGLAAALLTWQGVFYSSSIALVAMAIAVFSFATLFEKKGIIRYDQFEKQEKQKGVGVKALFKRQIVKFTLIAMITGVIRTSVVFWMPTYFNQYLGFTPDQSALIFTVSTLLISAAAFIAVFVYERLGSNMDKTILVMFGTAAISFLLIFLVKQPIINIFFMAIAIMAANGVSTMMWSRYCPGLRDTGMVSSVTGFLDFVSYMSASLATNLFADAATTIGWKNLILIWAALMVAGFLVSVPYGAIKKKKEK